VQEWWGEPDEAFDHIGDMVEGRGTTRPFIMTLDGVPVGHIQCWYLGHHQNACWVSGHPWLLEFPPDAVGVDLAIGEAALLSRGIGSAALSAFVPQAARRRPRNRRHRPTARTHGRCAPI
jgi:aminoglycoside 6'-N-acetyltransferase